jgi:(E)-4-hydroxy-3-methylbut-2-enyl-diphosphate synthase
MDVDAIAKEVEKRLAGVELPITVAIMGCVVNGPGEAKQADIGIAGGGTAGALFRHGVLVKRVPKEELLDALMAEIAVIAKEMGKEI